jgi:hypothetical protein
MVSKSPGRMTFQKEKYIKRQKENGEDPSPEYLDFFDKSLEQYDTRFDNPESRKNNLEYDLLTTDWILEKTRSSEYYAQNLYAAFCNNSFTKLDVIPILTEQEWSCSWRYAGGIVADMRQEGDYIDWYCSGIRDRHPSSGEEENWTDEQKQLWETVFSKYVPEGMITEEIKQDLKTLGWVAAKGGDWEHFE